MHTRHICALATVVLLACGLLGCGGSDTKEAVVIRVGDVGITNATVAHWMSVMAPQHVLPIPPHYDACVKRQRGAKPGSSTASLERVCRGQYAALRQQALAFLISSRWLTGEAAAEGMKVSTAEVRQRLQQRKRSFPSESEFNDSLHAIAHSVADVEREIEGELAAQKLRRRLIAEAPKVTSAEIAAYYRQNIARFRVPEQREFDIVENLRSEAIARRQMREAKAGKHLLSLHESFPRKPFTDYVGEKRTIYEAIFKARPHVFTGPIRLNEFYFLIRVTHIAPARVEPLRRVHGAIEKQISAERNRKALARFVGAWRQRWRARTDCHAGYVVQKCRQYAGPKTAEEPLALS